MKTKKSPIMPGEADIKVKIVYGTKIFSVRVKSYALLPMEKWYNTAKQDVFDKTDGPYNVILDVSNTIPALPVTWTADEAVDAIKFLLRVFHEPVKKGIHGLPMKDIILVHHMDSVLGLTEPYRDWMKAGIKAHAENLDARVASSPPIDASEWELTLLAAQTIGDDEQYRHIATSLVRSSVLSVSVSGKPVLKPTGQGLITGAVCGVVAADGLVEVRDEALRFLIGTANHGVAKYQRSRHDSAACRACIGARLAVLMGALGDLNLWPAKKPEDLKGVSLWDLQQRMEGMGAGVGLSERVAKYANVCSARAHKVAESNLFSVTDVACDMWQGIHTRIYLDVGGHLLMKALFRW